MFVTRKIPESTSVYTLTSNGGDFGMVNLGGNDFSLMNEITKIDNYDQIFIENKKVNIYFPAWEYFYRDEFHSENDYGFTLGEILKLISSIGYVACGESWIRDKKLFTEGTTFSQAAQSVGEFAVCEFSYEGNNVYVNVDH